MTEHARLVITAGEPAGIGPDVVLGALQSPFDAQIAVVGDVQVLEQRAIALGMDLQFTLLPLDAAPPLHTPGKVSVYHIPCEGQSSQVGSMWQMPATSCRPYGYRFNC